MVKYLNILKRNVCVKKDGDEFVSKSFLILIAVAVGALFFSLMKPAINAVFAGIMPKITEFIQNINF